MLLFGCKSVSMRMNTSKLATLCYMTGTRVELGALQDKWVYVAGRSKPLSNMLRTFVSVYVAMHAAIQ